MMFELFDTKPVTAYIRARPAEWPDAADPN